MHPRHTTPDAYGKEDNAGSTNKADTRLCSYAGHQPFSIPAAFPGRILIILQIT